MKSATGIGKRDFKKMCARNKVTIETSNKSSITTINNTNCDGEHKSSNKNNTINTENSSNNISNNNNNNATTITNLRKANTQYMHFTVVDVISEQGMQPLVLLAADMHEAFHLVLVYEISANIFKVGDLISCIPREKITEVT